MGWNTTVVVYNDALDAIAGDKEFGAKLAAAVSQVGGGTSQGGRHVDVPAGNHSNAAMVVESHHADSTALVTVGGNLGIEHLTRHGWDHHTPEGELKLLQAWAKKMGYGLVKQGE